MSEAIFHDTMQVAIALAIMLIARVCSEHEIAHVKAASSHA